MAGDNLLSVADAIRFIQQSGDKLVAILNGRTDWPDKSRRVQMLIGDVIDVAGIARFALGRFWNATTDTQRAEIVRYFPRVMFGAITKSIGALQDMSFTIDRGRRRDAEIEVLTTILRPGDPPRQVNWRIAVIGDSVRVTDILADGTSLRITARDDCASFLARNNYAIGALIERLRQQGAGSIS